MAVLRSCYDDEVVMELDRAANYGWLWGALPLINLVLS
jgi:hypothetical protein